MKSNNPVVSSVIKDYTYSQRAFLPRIVTVPLSQEDGVSYNCLVNPGDVVKEGSVIAVSEGTKSLINIHSPLPGTVTEISKNPPSFPRGILSLNVFHQTEKKIPVLK